ncbi:C39 family peptidase [Parendozoicomonas haliclonae]|uniref:Peptidase C39 family protein n=1 Tax=Parendozoicomonas haliclonae TaxID=1960125 RepID=A0A1X7AL64_9GAMM|nr:C39 family peptidase [Parendozoicomonas haliclonae]SMA48012.1 Peptidase C39 family protein [Parendozoicomonas haliclonae]
MVEVLVGSLLTVFGVTTAIEVKPKEQGTVYYEQQAGMTVTEQAHVDPLSNLKFKNIVRQAYDYSCGAAALTTLLDYYLGRNLTERQVMEGLLKFGEAEKIVSRRAFSLLDMKRFVRAIGHRSGGYRASINDLIDLDHPAIVPIEYAGFKHFVVVRDVYQGHVYVADPAVGNISFTIERFKEVWDQNVLFIVFPNGHAPLPNLELRPEDMRVVEDATLTYLAFNEMPQFTQPEQRRADAAAAAVRAIITDETGKTSESTGGWPYKRQ